MRIQSIQSLNQVILVPNYRRDKNGGKCMRKDMSFITLSDWVEHKKHSIPVCVNIQHEISCYTHTYRLSIDSFDGKLTPQ